MKNKLTIYLAALLLVPIVGCTSFLDTKPYSSTVVDNFYQTADDAELALTGCYQAVVAAVMQNEWGRGSYNAGIPAMLDGGTDECVLREGMTDALLGSVPTGAFTALDDIFKYTWSFLYKGISRCNFLLDHIEGIDMDGDRKDEIIGEARFLRGFFYYHLGILYGGAPVYTTSDQDAYAPRNTLEEVFDRVIEDMKYAYEVLPDRPRLEGRAHKWSAAGFLVKTYCYLASCRTNDVGEDLSFELNSFRWVDASAFYRLARDISEDIIDNSGFILTQHYDRLFRETTEKAQYEECLFTGETSPAQATGDDNLAWLFYQIPVGASNITGGGYGWYRPTGEMYYKLYDVLDPRRDHNLAGTLMDRPDAVEYIDDVKYYKPQPATPAQDTYCIAKFRYRDPAEKKISIALSEGNYPILRFADILLLNAEARYFCGDEPGARERLSEVRERVSDVYIADGPALSYLNQRYRRTSFVDELLEERSRELCFEAQRRTDLIRFGKIFTAIASLSDGEDPSQPAYWNRVVRTLQANWDGATHKVWFPLPLNDVLLNRNLVQNPKYQSR